ncbi:MAG: lipocalin family protein [Bacteroidales bacterium]|nr:lipocalin family protein [Bacteroidales bacterium]MBK8884163.1 lipocalin family protein [Bacteroidales bacterium]
MKYALALVLTNLLVLNVYSQNLPTVVSGVDLERYQGTWYEIARLPNFFEKKLKCITANYTIRADGKISVLNSGSNIEPPYKPSSAEGVAWVPDKNIPAKLKVRFFWPFSGDYWIIYLDKDYRYVLVGDPSFKYLWILCREKKLEETTYQMLLKKAIDNGYDVSGVIRVNHDCN